MSKTLNPNIYVLPHWHDADGTVHPNCGYFQEFELEPFTGWRDSKPCDVCGEVRKIFFMRSGGGKITRFWSDGHPNMPRQLNRRKQ